MLTSSFPGITNNDTTFTKEGQVRTTSKKGEVKINQNNEFILVRI